MNTNTKAENFYPIHDLSDKMNFQRFILVDKEGKTKRRIVLIIPDMELREEIICGHYLSRYVQIFLKELVGVKHKSRDNPWDFHIEMSNGEEHIIEITAIADQINLFKAFKSQERVIDKSQHETISFRELMKLNDLFPNNAAKAAIEEHQFKNLDVDSIVPNPLHKKDFLFESNLDEEFETFADLLKAAINKKVEKNHPNKEEVTLIIDNRTVSYDLDVVISQLDDMYEYFAALPFKEIWMYTGYYSDFTGDNAEYCLAPLKISDEKAEMIAKEIE
ncbi:MAG: hypothetical protein GVY20_05510 [Bacteroidetes bacterium]|jgi:hypothetical protein|nr:hypothetical protein [Bacteroidota bacterium]